MHYEEQVIDGVLMCRNSPEGEWRRAESAHAEAVNALLRLSSQQRKSVFDFFCVHCGDADPGCVCWNDE